VVTGKLNIPRKKKIGIKYCGGCNPTYERVELIRRAQALVEDRFLFVGYEEQDLYALVSVEGCPRACACADFKQGRLPSRSITEETDWGGLIDWLRALDTE
jgi:hypothetical protein